MESLLGQLWVAGYEKASIKSKIRLLDRAVFSVASFRFSRWPPQQQIAKELDRVQIRMYVLMLNERLRPDESVSGWVKRRMTSARGVVKSIGFWSHKWFERAKKWDEHIERHDELIVSPLRVWKGEQWLQDQRVKLLPLFSRVTGRLSMSAGVTGTRIAKGRVQARWHDGISYAKEHEPAGGASAWLGLPLLGDITLFS